MRRARFGIAAAVLLVAAGSSVFVWRAATSVPDAPASLVLSPPPTTPPTSPSASPSLSFTFKADKYDIHPVSRAEFPYAHAAPIPLVDKEPHDASGVRMFRTGGRLYDQPVHQARYGIDNLESYVITDDPRYLQRAKAQAARLMKRADKVRGAWYLPYPTDFTVHEVAADRRVAPWYSAMAQGQALTLLVRLYEITKDDTYRTAADGVFATFLRPRGAAKPWVVWVDDQEHLWLEEFPGKEPDRTLNGHLFATNGLWDYWRLTSDERAKNLFQGALTTVRDYFPRFRNPEWISKYCYSHPIRQAENYHHIHGRLLKRFFTLTHELEFLRESEILTADFPPPEVKGAVRLAAGTHQGVKFTAKGAVTGRKTIRLQAASSAKADQRIRIKGQPGYWYRITSGAFAGYHVRERYAVVALQGSSLSYVYPPGRPATLTASKTYTGFKFARDGKVLSEQKVAPAENTPFVIEATAWWNAREYVLAKTGPLAGRWIHRATLSL